MILRDRAGVVVKIENMILQSRLWWYGHVMHGDINSQMYEVMKVEIIGKRNKDQPRKSWEGCVKKGLVRDGLRREDGYDQNKWQKRVGANIANPGQPR